MARRKTLFDDRPVEINELTYIIKQDLASLGQQIMSLQSLQQQQSNQRSGGAGGDKQVGEHNKNVVLLLNERLTTVGKTFKDVLEVRTQNIQASRSRTENFISAVSQHSIAPPSAISGTGSPLYSTPNRGATPSNGPAGAAGGAPGFGGESMLTLNPMSAAMQDGSGGVLVRGSGPASDSQLLMMEEAQPQNQYIQQRGQAIEAIEQTISELGSIFGQLAQMVSEQGDMIQRIDANTEDVVDNVQGAQRELLKYWSRVSGNRWLLAQMFGVLMVFFL